MSEMADAIRALSQEKGVSEDSIRGTIETAIKAAYKKSFGQCENCIVIFEDDMSDVKVYARKTVVDGVYDPTLEIEIDEAKELDPQAEEGDELDIQVDPKNFERSAVTSGKQQAHMGLNESYKTNLLNAYKSKLHEVIIAYYQREYKGNIYLRVDNKDERVEGVLPAKFRSPRDMFQKEDRIRAYVTDLKTTQSGLQLIMSRTDPNFVRKLFEVEITEIGENLVEIKNIVREAGYRTKVAVASNKMDIDPVGACVGKGGMRIQGIIRELDGEKIDVLKWDEDPHVFIKNALLPAEVQKVVILNAERKEALAIVEESQFSLAIGKSGLNVRLANRLCDWSIDVKTVEQAAELDLVEDDSRRAAEQLFGDIDSQNEADGDDYTVSSLEGVDPRVAEILKSNDLDDLQKFTDAVADGSINNIEGLTPEDIASVEKIVSENVVFEDEEEEEAEAEVAQEEAEEEEYFCPECGAKITLDMTKCPKCGVEFSFE